MKPSNVTSMGAGLLLIALIGQVGSLKLVKQPVAVPAPVQQQEEAVQQEQLQQQRHFEMLQRQQQQAEYQIQQQQLEADRLLARPQLVQQPARQEFAASGVKGGAPPTAHLLPLPPPAPFRPLESYERQQYAPARSTIAYLVVRPPYQTPYDETPYRGYYLTRPQAYAEYPRQTLETFDGTKGGARQQGAPAPPPPPPPPPPPQVEPQAPPPPPPPQPALVVPVQADKQGKLKAMLDKLMSKFSFSTYEVAGEEYVNPPPPPPPPSNPSFVRQEPPFSQQPFIQQQHIEQVREESHTLLEQPVQQQQQSVEQERDQGFDEAVKSPAPAPNQPVEQTKQEVKEELAQQQQQQQQLQEQDFSRQPVKGNQQPARLQEPAQQQQRQEEVKAPRRYVLQQQQQQFVQQEPLRQEQKGGF